jgi:hypothetical protein
MHYDRLVFSPEVRSWVTLGHPGIGPLSPSTY